MNKGWIYLKTELPVTTINSALNLIASHMSKLGGGLVIKKTDRLLRIGHIDNFQRQLILMQTQIGHNLGH